MEKDPERVRRLAAQKDDENWEFRAFLKSCKLGEKRLDAIVHRLYEEVAAQVDCCDCANCCKVMSPVLRQRDVARLAACLGVSPEDLVQDQLEATEDAPGHVFRRLPCPLLADSRCTVYEARPDNCRSFPHLHKDEFLSRLIAVVENCAICPIVYNVYEMLKKGVWKQEHVSFPWDDQDDEWENEDCGDDLDTEP